MNPEVFLKVGYGMYIVSAGRKGSYNGQIANAVVQVCSKPVLMAAAINKQNLTHRYILETGLFSVSILSNECDMKFIGKFGFKSGTKTDKFSGTEYTVSGSGIPVVTENTIAYFGCKLHSTVDVGTHSLFLGKVIEAKILSDKSPLTYRYYRDVLKGKSPKTAPTYIDKTTIKERKMAKYECSVCGWVYDPALGDPDNGIPAGTAFEDLPDDWTCPECGVGKEEFVKMGS